MPDIPESANDPVADESGLHAGVNRTSTVSVMAESESICITPPDGRVKGVHSCHKISHATQDGPYHNAIPPSVKASPWGTGASATPPWCRWRQCPLPLADGVVTGRARGS